VDASAHRLVILSAVKNPGEATALKGCEHATGFFAALLMNALFVILNEVKNPIAYPHAVALLDSSPSLRMTSWGKFTGGIH
jgi:hypothetical protein